MDIVSVQSANGRVDRGQNAYTQQPYTSHVSRRLCTSGRQCYPAGASQQRRGTLCLESHPVELRRCVIGKTVFEVVEDAHVRTGDGKDRTATRGRRRYWTVELDRR